MKIPFGIAQTAKHLGNEIVARQFIQNARVWTNGNAVFVKPGEEMQWYNYWKKHV
jgi:glycyl-tRNA synthetase